MPRPSLVVACLAACAWATAVGARQLVAIEAAQHDPLYLDTASVRRDGASVSFKYLLDVLAPPDLDSKPSVWKSNEIEATLDCRQRTVVVHRLVTYPGPRGAGSPTAVVSFTAPGRRPEPIAPGSTFAHLEAHLCRGAR